MIISLFVISLESGSLKQADSQQPIIHITAMKYQYVPNHIELKKGTTVTLVLTSLDRTHGFNIPALNIRANVLPQQSVRLRVTADKTGRFTFLCDLFCGSGHGEMNGVITVTE
jgi:cytochrome c oxidase subunit 2